MSSPAYRDAVDAQAYFGGENTAISKRLNYMERHGVANSRMVFHKVHSGIFTWLILQLAGYELGNGVTLPPEIKDRLGLRFDNSMQKIGQQALVDGVNWGYWQAGSKTVSNATGAVLSQKSGKLMIFRATEFVPLFDEMTGDMRVGIRFTQIAPDKPYRIELFEEDGLTVYKADKGLGGIEILEPKTPYMRKIKANIKGEQVFKK